jgi:hypothetical protein
VGRGAQRVQWSHRLEGRLWRSHGRGQQVWQRRSGECEPHALWHFLAVTYRADATFEDGLSLFVNSVPITQTYAGGSGASTNGVPATVADAAYIGTRPYDQNTPMYGQIGAVYVWDRALSPREIAEVYGLGRP